MLLLHALLFLLLGTSALSKGPGVDGLWRSKHPTVSEYGSLISPRINIAYLDSVLILLISRVGRWQNMIELRCHIGM